MNQYLVLLLAASSLADYPYYDYGYYSPSVSNFTGKHQTQRVFDPNQVFKVVLTTGFTVPVPDFDSTLTLELPFTMEFGGSSRRNSYQGR